MQLLNEFRTEKEHYTFVNGKRFDFLKDKCGGPSRFFTETGVLAKLEGAGYINVVLLSPFFGKNMNNMFGCSESAAVTKPYVDYGYLSNCIGERFPAVSGPRRTFKTFKRKKAPLRMGAKALLDHIKQLKWHLQNGWL